jgi:hypothetical protein
MVTSREMFQITLKSSGRSVYAAAEGHYFEVICI